MKAEDGGRKRKTFCMPDGKSVRMVAHACMCRGKPKEQLALGIYTNEKLILIYYKKKLRNISHKCPKRKRCFSNNKYNTTHIASLWTSIGPDINWRRAQKPSSDDTSFGIAYANCMAARPALLNAYDMRSADYFGVTGADDGRRRRRMKAEDEGRG